MKKRILPLGWVLFVLFIVGSVALHILGQDAGKEVSVRSVGEIIGGSIALVAAASVVAVPWRLLERLFGAYSNGLVGAALIIFVVVLFLALKGERYDELFLGKATQMAAANPMHLSGCELTVVFPEKPTLKKIRTNSGDQLIEINQLELATPMEYLRAECLPISIDQSSATDILNKQAIAEGLQFAEFENVKPSVVRMRAHKKVVGIETTFVIEIHRSSKSALVLVAAAKSSDYPTIGTTRFLDSVR